MYGYGRIGNLGQDPSVVGAILPGATTLATTSLMLATPVVQTAAYVAARQALVETLSSGVKLTAADQQSFIEDAMNSYAQTSGTTADTATTTIVAPAASSGLNLFGYQVSWLLVGLLGLGIYYVMSEENSGA